MLIGVAYLRGYRLNVYGFVENFFNNWINHRFSPPR